VATVRDPLEGATYHDALTGLARRSGWIEGVAVQTDQSRPSRVDAPGNAVGKINSGYPVLGIHRDMEAMPGRRQRLRYEQRGRTGQIPTFQGRMRRPHSSIRMLPTPSSVATNRVPEQPKTTTLGVWQRERDPHRW
jgi:hypothetical protein